MPDNKPKLRKEMRPSKLRATLRESHPITFSWVGLYIKEHRARPQRDSLGRSVPVGKGRLKAAAWMVLARKVLNYKQVAALAGVDYGVLRVWRASRRFIGDLCGEVYRDLADSVLRAAVNISREKTHAFPGFIEQVAREWAGWACPAQRSVLRAAKERIEAHPEEPTTPDDISLIINLSILLKALLAVGRGQDAEEATKQVQREFFHTPLPELGDKTFAEALREMNRRWITDFALEIKRMGELGRLTKNPELGREPQEMLKKTLFESVDYYLGPEDIKNVVGALLDALVMPTPPLIHDGELIELVVQGREGPSQSQKEEDEAGLRRSPETEN